MDYHGRAGPSDALLRVFKWFAERLGGMVDPDPVLAPSALGDGRPPLPLPARPRAIVHVPASARLAGTSRLLLQPATGASATTTSLPLIGVVSENGK